MTENAKELRWIRILLMIIAVPMIVLILKTLQTIFIPLVFAIFLSFVFAPFTAFLRKEKVHIAVIMLTMVVIILLFSFLTVLLLTAATNNLLAGFPRYQDKFVSLVEGGIIWFENLTAKMDIAFGSFQGIDLTQMLAPGSFSITKAISDVMSTTLGISWNFFLIVIFLLFIIAEGGTMGNRLKKVMSDSDQQHTGKALLNIQIQIQRYLITKTGISLATALVGMLLMVLYGVDFVLICGILLFVLNFIPNIGSVLASSVPIFICLLQGGFDLRFVTFSILIVATQMLFGNVIEPKIQGKRLNLSPITVLVSLIFWGWVWGIVGMILAVPITSAINIILIQIDEKNLVSAIISGKE